VLGAEVPSTKASIGTFYSRSGITVFHGDCLRILPHLPEESVNFVLTDPTYLVNYVGRWDGAKRAIVGDGDSCWVRPAFAEILRVMKRDSLCLSFYGYPHGDIFVGVWKALGFRIVSHFAFVKNVWGLGRFTRGQHETA
jgi:adenine-specific DNA-methyltransferase